MRDWEGRRRGLGARVPVGLLAFVVVCRLLIVGDSLGRHREGGRGGANVAFVTLRPGPAWDIAKEPFIQVLPVPLTPFSVLKTLEDFP